MRLLLLFLLAACGDNIVPTDDRPDTKYPVDPDPAPVDSTVDAGAPDADDLPGKAACCNGAQHGDVPHECGTPPGVSGCKSWFCDDGVILYVCQP